MGRISGWIAFILLYLMTTVEMIDYYVLDNWPEDYGEKSYERLITYIVIGILALITALRQLKAPAFWQRRIISVRQSSTMAFRRRNKPQKPVAQEKLRQILNALTDSTSEKAVTGACIKIQRLHNAGALTKSAHQRVIATMKGVFQACKTPNHSIKGLRSILELWQSLQEHSHTKTDSAKLDLSLAKLAGADLYKANLPHANLHKADLKRALLQEANLREANLTGANLQEADLRWVNLTGAVLRGASLGKADLDFSCLKGAKNLTKRQLQGAKSIKRTHHGVKGIATILEEKCVACQRAKN